MIIGMPSMTLERLCSLIDVLDFLQESGKQRVSSEELGRYIFVSADTIRQDIHYIGELGPSPRGYSISDLRSLIDKKMFGGVKRHSCIVGLDAVGLAILSSGRFDSEEYAIAAGFDTNVNKLEILQTKIPLYPFHVMSEVLRDTGISLAILCTQPEETHEALSRLVAGGVKGIINMTRIPLQSPENGIYIRNYDLIHELRVAAVLAGGRS